jgi:hypothetical protein
VAELSIVNSHKGTIVAGLLAPMFVLALPIVDVALAITRRGLKGLPIFRPDRPAFTPQFAGYWLFAPKGGPDVVFFHAGIPCVWIRGILVGGTLGADLIWHWLSGIHPVSPLVQF